MLYRVLKMVLGVTIVCILTKGCSAAAGADDKRQSAKAENVAADDGSRQDERPTRAPGPVRFGAVTERQVSDDSAKSNHMLDLDTGDFYAPPDDKEWRTDPRSAMRRAITAGADVYYDDCDSRAGQACRPSTGTIR